MAKKKNGGGSRRPTATYPVGYGKPPKATQFKPGQSGNPNGRPRKTEPTLDEALSAMMDEPITISEQGQRRVVPYRDALVRSLAAKALNDAKVGLALMRYMDRTSLGGSQTSGEYPVQEEDEEILGRWRKRIVGTRRSPAHEEGNDD
ncbi:DUF5681 domain-containing protein [Microvirga sp. CF3062]|uniref:DUF5681 domain-containing protein n=1 Tax=Microvirga sp. CF3062 TaxID=3110182 RepID=UPI002E79DD9C|nr:DUF5681 domain-containing protein [Microvirga sp. CF3062]MEE1656743.1 DUF5681 domain-containing protein [Microvirga sp. CF3062]